MIEAARERLAKVGLDIDPTKKAGELSFAARQMVELAKALSLEERTSAALDDPSRRTDLGTGNQGHKISSIE